MYPNGRRKPEMSQLETRIRAVNAANDFANKLHPRLIAVFGDFVNEKIEKVNGDLLQKVQKGIELLNLPNTNKLSVYRNRSNYSLSYVVKTCEVADGRAHYHETVVQVGEMSNGVLTQLNMNPYVYKTDYTAAQIQVAREQYAIAKRYADDAHGKLHPFGEYDR